jgi:rSAM/selenodomain-associated transferase 1
MTMVALFAKAPRVGRVKTRLAADIGPVAATALYRRIGRQVAGAVASVCPVTVWYDPAGAEREMRVWLGDHSYRLQGGRDLGGRLRAAFDAHFAAGDAPVVAIGTDCPAVDAAVIGEAEERLRSADVVIGPSADGGYYLLGMNEPHPCLFVDVPWSTPDVLGITAKRCREHDLSVEVLRTLRDLDTVEDLEALVLGPT